MNRVKQTWYLFFPPKIRVFLNGVEQTQGDAEYSISKWARLKWIWGFSKGVTHFESQDENDSIKPEYEK